MKKLIVVVGGTNLDVQGKSFKPFLQRDSNPGRIERTAGGVGRNIAENLARLGGDDFDVELISAFSVDDDSKFLMAECEKSGVRTPWSFTYPNCSTARYLCLLEDYGQIVGAVADMSIMESLGPADLATRGSLLDEADCIVLDANLREDSIAWVAEKYGRHSGRAHGGAEAPLLVVDPVSATKATRLRPSFACFHVAKPNLAEAAAIAGLTSSDPEEIADRLAADSRLPEELYISLGEEGIFFASDGGDRGIVELPRERLGMKTANRSGAGDAACAALAWASLVQGGADGQTAANMAFKARCAIAAALFASADNATVNKNISGPGVVKALESWK